MYDLIFIQKLRTYQTVLLYPRQRQNGFMSKWPISVLFALSDLCFFILMMSLEETLSPVTKGELPFTLSSYSCWSKFVRKALKFLTSREIPASFRCNLLLFISVFLDLYYCE